jgi:hypothetical protein
MIAKKNTYTEMALTMTGTCQNLKFKKNIWNNIEKPKIKAANLPVTNKNQLIGALPMKPM